MRKQWSTRWISCALLLLVGGCSSSSEFLRRAAQTAEAASNYDRLHLALQRGNMDELVSASKDYARNTNKSDEALILNSIGYLLADQGDQRAHFEAAETLTRRAVELANANVQKASRENIKSRIESERSNRAMIRDSLAWALFRLERYEEALAEQKQAVAEARDTSKTPQINAELYFHLAEIYAALGQKEEAQRAYQDALGDDPGYEPAKQALKKLGKNKSAM